MVTIDETKTFSKLDLNTRFNLQFWQISDQRIDQNSDQRKLYNVTQFYLSLKDKESGKVMNYLKDLVVL